MTSPGPTSGLYQGSLSPNPVPTSPLNATASLDRYREQMLVWVASFPRSGNTFLRIVINRRFGISSSVVYDRDGVANRLGPELIGYTDRPAPLAEMRAATETHFIKTHRPRDDDVDSSDHAICLVRDGRDALVSWARMLSEDQPAVFPSLLQQLIENTTSRSSGSWGPTSSAG